MSIFTQSSHICLFLLILFSSEIFLLSEANFPSSGTAAFYSPPYTPTACYGDDTSRIPTTLLFGAAGEAVWDHAVCGKNFEVRCVSTVNPPKMCKGDVVRVTIVDRALTAKSRPSARGAALVLHPIAFSTIVNGNPSTVNIEYQEV